MELKMFFFNENSSLYVNLVFKYIIHVHKEQKYISFFKLMSIHCSVYYLVPLFKFIN
jgi:hypothetical protein